MQSSFKAKDIQKILQISEHRYKYIVSKLGICAEAEKRFGQGKTRLYTIKNLLQFSFVNAASRLGLTLESGKTMLNIIDEFNEERKGCIYDPSTKVEILALFIVEDEQDSFYCLQEKTLIAFGKDESAPEYKLFWEPYFKADSLENISPEKAKKYSNMYRNLWLLNIEGCVSINLGVLKKRVLAKIT
jgi:DNA-binding transcriptional MerR regulator